MCGIALEIQYLPTTGLGWKKRFAWLVCKDAPGGQFGVQHTCMLTQCASCHMFELALQELPCGPTLGRVLGQAEQNAATSTVDISSNTPSW
jgi:hypothetical protein